MLFNRFIHLLKKIAFAASIVLACCGATTHHTDIKKKHVHNTHKKSVPVATNNIQKNSVNPHVSSDASIQEGIDQIINSFGHKVNVGVIVQSTLNGATLYDHNANRVYMPASTMKVFTASAALLYLGPNFIFPTQLLSDAQPRNGVLPGNLYVKFSGDPLLTVDQLSQLIANLARLGIRQIQGNLIIDDTALDEVNWAPGWMWDEQILCYAAPATGIMLNKNCFGFSLGTGKSNTPGDVKVYNTLANIDIINKVTARNAHRWECPLNLRASTGSNTYTLSGCLSPHHKPIAMAVALNAPREAGTQIVLGLLKKNGVSIQGTVEYTATPNTTKVLAQHDSVPLSQLVTHMLKKSDNLIADTLFKKLGGAYFNTTGTWSNGAEAVKQILAPRTGVNFNNLVMVDGAGLSRYDFVSPEQLAMVLNYDYRSLPTNTLFYQALPISGMDGTLRFRLGGNTLGRIHAKTGTMNSISGLAGYVETANHQPLTFAIMINGFVGSQATFHLLEDRICAFLAEKTI